MTNKAITPPFRFLSVSQDDYQFYLDVLSNGFFDMLHLDQSIEEGQEAFWEADFEIFIVERKNKQPFSEILARETWRTIEGIWYGEASVLDAYTVFEETSHYYRIAGVGIDLVFLIKRIPV